MPGMCISQNRLSRIVLALTLAFAVAVPDSGAFAQERQERRTLLQLLFGTPKRVEEPPPQKRTPRRRKPAAESVTTINTLTNAPTGPVQKVENARKILVIGDFFAGGIADGLQEAFEQSPGVVVEGRSNGSSGLVRADYYDWQAQFPQLLDELKPALAVVQLGANDRQQMTVAGEKVDFRSEPWTREYESRIAALIRVAVERRIPLLWVGIPPFQSPKLSSDAITLNGIFRANVEKAGGEFIDIWEGFVDQDGRFVVTGSDIKGQQVRLRGSDGINMTAAGKRKMAFYIEKSARRHLGEMASPDLVRLDASNLPALVSLPPSEMKIITSTPPIDVSDPNLDGGSALLGGAPLTTISAIPTARDMLVQKGEAGTPPPGRIDDYRVLRTGTTP